MAVLGQFKFNPLSPKSDQHQTSPCNINALCKTEWSWELSTSSGKMSLTDIWTNSPYYFYWKSIGTVNENLNFDFRVQRVMSLLIQCLWIKLAHLPLPWALNINTHFSLRAKYWLMGGLGGQFAGTSTDPCLYPCTKCSCRDTAISRKVVGKKCARDNPEW